MAGVRRATVPVLGAALAVGTLLSPGAAAQSAFPASFPGLISTSVVAVSGSADQAMLQSTLGCPDVIGYLGSTEWTLESSSTRAAAAGFGSLTQALLTRGAAEAMAVLQGPVDGGCHGTLTILSPQPVTLTGPIAASGTGHFWPQACDQLTDGMVSIQGVYQVTDTVGEVIAIAVPPTTGSHAVDPFDQPQLAVATGKLDLVDWYTNPQAFQDRGQSTFAMQSLDDFEASVTVAATDPMSGTLSARATTPRGNETVSDGFSCTIAPADLPTPASAPASVPFGATLTSEYDSDTSHTGLYIKDDDAVTINGTLVAITPWRYQATITAQASGTIDEPSFANLSKRCRNRWTGSQQLRLVGVVGSSGLDVDVEPVGPARFRLKQPCNAAGHRSDTDLPGSPLGTAELPGAADATFAWPPSMGTATQHVVVGSSALPGTINSRTWDLRFEVAG